MPASGQGFLERVIDPELGRTAQRIRARHDTALGAVLEAAWAIVLARFTREDAVAFAFGSDGQDPSPVQLTVDRALTVREFVASIQRPRLTASRAGALPVGSTCLVVRDATESAVRDSGGDRPPKSQPGETWPLSVQVWQREGLPIGIELRFDLALYRESMVERLARALLFTLGDLGGDDARVLADLRAIPEADRRLLLHTWNDTARPFAEDTLLHEPFERRARLQPTAIAVESDQERLSYRELDERANRLAHALRSGGARPGVRVGICLRRGSDLIVAMLAVSKSGAAYVPLDPAYPEERLQAMLANAAPALVITDAPARDFLATERLLLTPAVVADGSAEPLERSATPDDVCYVIYTSGSTGKQKGVVLQHRAVINTFDWVTRTFEVGPGDRLLFVTSPSFDLSVYDTFGALGAGATVVMADEALLADPPALAAALSARAITIWDSAPAALEFIAPFLAAAAVAKSLRLVLLSGDFISLGLVARARAAFPNARLVSLGGATEAAIWSNWFPIESMAPESPAVPYGRPIQNCRYYVLDEHRDPVPIGVVGELYIGGACVAQGYLEQPELTAARFVPDPFSTAPNARLYRTGDLVRHLDDGTLEILGRLDSQVKIRGFRVELAEVEAALNALPAVSQAVCVAARLDASQQKGIVAYVVPRDGQLSSEATLKRKLALKLPDFMIPSRIVVLPALPLSPNGKVDRNALPRPTGEEARSALVDLPRTETERELARIWQELLRRAPVGRTDDFFALGGHSLLAIQLLNELHRVRGVRLSPAILIQHPTLASLAERIDELHGPARSAEATEWTTLVPIRTGGSLPPLFCIAGLGGNPLPERLLAAELGDDQPVYGLQHRGVDGQRPPHDDIRAMAAEFVAHIRQLRPQGPYYLGGFSGGGVVAFEMARMLAERGERVPLLVLLDAFNPTLPRWRWHQRPRLFAQMCLNHGPRYASRRLFMRLESKLEAGLFRLMASAPDSQFKHRYVRGQAAFVGALARYRPRPYAGDAVLIRSSSRLSADVDFQTDEWNGWRALIDGAFQVTTLECRHDDLLGDHVRQTADIVRAALRSAREGAAT